MTVRANSPNRSTPGCLLTTLADPRLGGVLPGLNPVHGGFEFAAGAFACCHATGLRSSSKHSYCVCDLRPRMRSLSWLASVYERACCRGDGMPAWPGLVFQPDPKFLRLTLQRLALIQAGQHSKGIMYQLPAQAPQRYSLWSVAFTAIWRFGFDARVIGLDDPSSAKLLRAETQADSKAKATMIFIEAAAGLWDPQRADLFEAAVGFAYRARFPLWISWDNASRELSSIGAKRAGHGIQPVRRALAARLQRIKQRAPLDWIETSTRSKLQALCEIATSRSEPAKATERPVDHNGLSR